MTDVRLVATNPEDSSLVPVACTSAGLIKVATPIIEAIPNDLTVQGDLNVTGTINGNAGDGGSGLPEPYGPEGSVLTIKNGEPAWVVFDSPGVPAANTIFLHEDSLEPRASVVPFGLWDDNEIQDESTLQWDSFIKSTANWADPQPKLVGLGGKNGNDRNNIGPSFTFKLTCEIGMILDLYMTCYWEVLRATASETFIEEDFSELPENFTRLTTKYKGKVSEDKKEVFKHSFYITRPIDDYVTFRWGVGSDQKTSIIVRYAALSKWELYAPSKEQRQQITQALKAQREEAANS